MTTYYVDASQPDDTGDGLSEENAWKTINKVQTTLNGDQSDDIVKFKRGETWTEQYSVAGYGTSGSPFTHTNYGSGNRPVIDGEDTRDYCVYITSGKNYTIFDGLKLTRGVEHNYWAGSSNNLTINDCVSSYAAKHGIYIVSSASVTTITNTTSEYNGYSGIQLLDSMTHTITDNILRYNGQDTGDKYGSGIVGGATGNITFARNTVYNNGYGGDPGWAHNAYFGPLSGSSTYCNIYENVVYNSQAHGIYVKGSANIYRNISYNNTEAGIALYQWAAVDSTTSVYYNISYGNYWGLVYSPGGATGSMDLTIYNNVFYHNNNTDYGSGYAEMRFLLDVGTITIKNNIVHGDNAKFEWEFDNAMSSITIDYNCTRYADIWYNGASRDWTYWTETLGFDANGMNADPLFVDGANKDFHLKSDSPCIGKGEVLGLTLDYEKNGVPNGYFPDIGAYEWWEGAIVSELIKVEID